MTYIQRELFSGYSVGDFSPVRIMGIINLSPESFYPNSYIPQDLIAEKIQSFISNGATILDFGARSTAPWSESITIEEESKRINQILKIIPNLVPNEIIISIDTQYSEIARMVLEFGKENNYHIFVNDISAFTTDEKMIHLVKEYDCPVCIMASFQSPGDAKTPKDIITALSITIEKLQRINFDLNKVIIDPGVGKWIAEKTYEYDLAMLDKLCEFRAFNFPILIGLSRKSFIGTILNEEKAEERLIGSNAATSIAVYNGAHIIRTHDINQTTIQTIQIASAIRQKPIKIKEGNQICEILETMPDSFGTELFLKNLGVSPSGSKIMNKKMISKNIILRNITAPQCLILKQELIARGGDVALHREVITTENQKYNEKFTAVLIGSLLQIEKLISKLKNQDLELGKLANIIEKTLKKEHSIKEIYSKS